LDKRRSVANDQRLRRKKALLALLRDLRKEAGLRQTDLAKKLEKPQSYVSKYESGERRLDLLELEQVCQALGVRPKVLVERFEKDRVSHNTALR
jgi:transcriptional regulator with XRE-family HTH domain